MANHLSDVQDKDGELPSRDSFKFPTATTAGSSSSSAPQALVLTNVSDDKQGTDATLDGAEKQDGDEQKDSVAESSKTPILSPDEPIQSWMARNQGLWVCTPHVGEALTKLGVTKARDLQKYINVEDLLEKRVSKVDACKLLELVGGDQYRPMAPDKAVAASADVHAQQSSGNEAGSEARTVSQVREAESRGDVEMPRGSYLEILNRGRVCEAWTLEQRSPLCVQEAAIGGSWNAIGEPPRQWVSTSVKSPKAGETTAEPKTGATGAKGVFKSASPAKGAGDCA